MPEWLRNLLPAGGPSWGMVALGVALTLVSFFGSIALTAWALVRLPPDYFRGEKAHDPWVDHHPAMRWAMKIGRNLIGVFLMAAGIIMALPGVPGQGVLTFLIGVMLVDFPGKRKCEQWLVKKRRVRAAIDKVRARFGKPPLVLD